MSERIMLEAPVFDDGKTRIVLRFRARKVLNIWWSKDAVTLSSTAMFGAWEAIAGYERRKRERHGSRSVSTGEDAA